MILRQLIKSLLDSIDSTVGDTSHLVKNSAVNKAISDLRTQIGNLKTINIKVVTELPTSGQEPNVIYLIKHVKSSTDTSSAHTGATNIGTGAAETYDEYLWVAGDGKFEKIGNTDIDLSAYAKTADVKKQFDSKPSIDTANANDYPSGFYGADGTIQPITNAIWSSNGIKVRDHPDGSFDMDLDLDSCLTDHNTNGFMSAADKAKLDSFGTKCSYTFDSSTKKLTLSNTPTSYKVYYRKSTGVLVQLTVTNNVVTIPDDISSVIEVIVVDTTTTSKSVIII